MFFTKDFILDEVRETRELTEAVLDELRIPNKQTYETDILRRILFKLDVVRNAVKNVHTN
tara:strand:+ start:401 stop:580 length:180 start_codon:yes stop_codon:yes gene_type:complete